MHVRSWRKPSWHKIAFILQNCTVLYLNRAHMGHLSHKIGFTEYKSLYKTMMECQFVFNSQSLYIDMSLGQKPYTHISHTHNSSELKDSEFRCNSLMLSTHFLRRVYPKDLIFKALVRAESQQRVDLLKIKEKISDNVKSFYCIITHNPATPPLQSIVLNNWDQMLKSKTTRLYHDAKLIFGKRKNKSLKDKLVRATTSTNSQRPKIPHTTQHPCKRPNSCNYCPKLNKSGNLTSFTTGKKYRTLKSVNCQTSNLIYAITCSTCGIQYVGQTENKLLTRFGGHMFDIKILSKTLQSLAISDHVLDNPPALYAGGDLLSQP